MTSDLGEHFNRYLVQHRYLHQSWAQTIKETSYCWIWCNNTPIFPIKNELTGTQTTVSARRFAYECVFDVILHKKDIVVNKCGNKRCVSPYHSIVTSRRKVR